MLKKREQELLLAITIVAFLIFMFAFRGSKELKILLIFAFYFFASLIYDLDSRYPIIAAIFLLISSAIVLSKNEELANNLAIYAYYFLVVGVALQLVEYLREHREEEEEELPELRGKCIAIASGKGGVGKTTIASNLAVALAKIEKRCILIDFDFSMPNLDIAMGIKPEKNLKDFLFNNAEIEECIYYAHGCDVLPTLPIPNFFKKEENVGKLKELINGIKEKYEILLMDFPPGSNIELLEAIGRDMSLILVTNPEKLSLLDSFNIASIAREKENKVIGIILNRVEEEIDVDSIENEMGLPIIALLPEDSMVRESLNKEIPIVSEEPEREFSREIMKLAKFLVRVLS